MALRSWRRREGLVFLENDEKEKKGLTITEDGMVCRTNYKLAVGVRHIGWDTSHVIRDNTSRAI